MRLRRKVELKSHTTFRIGGPAERFYVVEKEQQLVQLWPRLLHDGAESPFLLGRGSNLLVDDGTIQRPVVRLEGEFRTCQVDGTDLEAGAAVLMPEASMTSARAGLSGLEWASGVPGSVGGAVMMNAGAYNSEVSDVLEWIEIITPAGDRERLDAGELKMEYRSTELPEHAVVVKAKFGLEQADPERSLQSTRALIEKRRSDQPVGPPSAGCMFKNPNGESAGELIDRVGLSGSREGDAEVSEQHANYFINRGEASCADVLRLRDRVRKKISDEFGYELETEVHRLE